MIDAKLFDLMNIQRGAPLKGKYIWWFEFG